jgi:phosphatidylglycerol:prolipoprotein diacylglycerol transferase
MNLDVAWYPLLTVAAMAVSIVVTSRFARRESDAGRGGALAIVWSGALVGAFLGAMLAYALAEGLLVHGGWRAFVSGRSITGALLGGYVGVEAAKRAVGWREPTGDLFAITVPLAIAIGRVGCVMAGCCQGVTCEPSWWTVADAHGHARWPAAQAELVFNAAFVGWAILAARFGWQRTQRFHIYLIAYGLFRFAHEFARDDVRFAGPIGGYHVVAALLVGLGAWRYAVRARAVTRGDAVPSAASR